MVMSTNLMINLSTNVCQVHIFHIGQIGHLVGSQFKKKKTEVKIMLHLRADFN